MLDGPQVRVSRLLHLNFLVGGCLAYSARISEGLETLVGGCARLAAVEGLALAAERGQMHGVVHIGRLVSLALAGLHQRAWAVLVALSAHISVLSQWAAQDDLIVRILWVLLPHKLHLVLVGLITPWCHALR